MYSADYDCSSPPLNIPGKADEDHPAPTTYDCQYKLCCTYVHGQSVYTNATIPSRYAKVITTECGAVRKTIEEAGGGDGLLFCVGN